MGEASQERHATDDEVTAMKAIVREGLEAGAVGGSFERNLRIRLEWAGWHRPISFEEEIFAVAGVADEVGRGVIQFGGDRVISTSSEGQPAPGFLRQHYPAGGGAGQMAQAAGEAESLMRQGHRGYQFVMPAGDLRYTLKDAQALRRHGTWKNVMLLPPRPAHTSIPRSGTRAKLHREAVETAMDTNAPAISRAAGICSFVSSPRWRKTSTSRARAWAEIAGNRIKTYSTHSSTWRWKKIWKPNSNGAKSTATKRHAALLTSPYTVIGQSDGGAHWFSAPTIATPPICCRTGCAKRNHVAGAAIRSSRSFRRRSSDSPTVAGAPRHGADLMIFDPNDDPLAEVSFAGRAPPGQTTGSNGDRRWIEDHQVRGAMPGRTSPRSENPKSGAGTNVSFRIASSSDMISFSRTQCDSR